MRINYICLTSKLKLLQVSWINEGLNIYFHYDLIFSIFLLAYLKAVSDQLTLWVVILPVSASHILLWFPSNSNFLFAIVQMSYSFYGNAEVVVNVYSSCLILQLLVTTWSTSYYYIVKL